MALEAATYINQLVASNPNGADPKGQGDDHLRLIKGAILNTFPAITGPVNLTQAQINSLADNTKFVFPGMIVMWSGNITNLPPGWTLCNGQGSLSNGDVVPDLRDRFIVGAGASYGVRGTGGNVTHAHGVTVDYHTLTEAEIPPHTHETGALGDNGGYMRGRIAAGGPTVFPGQNLSYTGGGQGHNHTASVGAADNRPPFYALAFIVKV